MIPFIKTFKKHFQDFEITINLNNENDFFEKHTTLNLLITGLLGLVISLFLLLVGITFLPFEYLDKILDWLYNNIIGNKYNNFILKSYFKKLNNSNKVYYLKHIPNREKINNISIKDFLIEFFNRNNNLYDTIDDFGYTVCGTHRRRTLHDIYLITKYYYPNTNSEQVLKILVELIKERKLYGSFCNDIKHFVFHKNTTYFDSKSKVEYGRNLTFEDVRNYFKTN